MLPRTQSKKELDARFKKQLNDNWGLETLVTVGESWLPAMLEQDAIGQATDIPVLKLFEFLVASICLFMIEVSRVGEATWRTQAGGGGPPHTAAESPSAVWRTL